MDKLEDMFKTLPTIESIANKPIYTITSNHTETSYEQDLKLYRLKLIRLTNLLHQYAYSDDNKAVATITRLLKLYKHCFAQYHNIIETSEHSEENMEQAENWLKAANDACMLAFILYDCIGNKEN